MAGEEPPFLPVGTDVSAKYRGAFCEAKVKKLIKLVKCKVTLKDNTHTVVTDEDIKGPLKTGLTVEVKHPDTGQFVEATINKVTDHSTYTVVFDDGDENTLRRTQLCLKGEKHFVKSETLDQLPLTHPEHFGTPVMKPKKRRHALNHDSGSESDDDSSVDSEAPRREYKGRLTEMIGRIVLMEIEDRKKTLWVPVLVVDPNANDLELKTKDHLLVKSFKDSKFYAVLKKDTKEFTRELAMKNDDKMLKNAYEKAIVYNDSKDLPSNWDKDELLGCEDEDMDSDSSDDEPTEEKDRFVAQLYKFMDDRDTPINKAPIISNKDVSLYRLFRVVQNIGGYNRTTNQAKWKVVYSKMGLPTSNTGPNQIKAIYKKYLHAFEDFYRKLGSTMGTISRPNRSRNNSGRSLLSFRERESPKSPRSDKGERIKVAEADSEKQQSPEKKVEEEKKAEDSENDSPRKSSRIRKATVDPDMEEERKLPEVTKPVTRVETARLAKEEPKPETPKVKEKATKKEETPSKRGRADREDSSTRSTKEDAKKPVAKKEEEKEKKAKEEDKKTKEESKVKEETKEEKTPKPAAKDDKDEGRQPKKRGRKRLKEEEKEAEESSVKKKKPEEKEESDEEKEVDIEEDEDEEQNDGDEEGDDTPREPVQLRRRKEPEVEYGVGSKLKVRYGRGRNLKHYEAKILEADSSNGSMQYLVHYSGWNNRYDEWVTKDRIVGLVELVEPSKALPIKPKASKKKKSSKKKSVGRGSQSGGSTPTHQPSDSPRPTMTRTKSPSQAGPPAKPRPTRQTSVESLHTPSLRRSRRTSSCQPESIDTQSHVSESDSEDRSLRDEKDDSLSIAESTDSKRPASPEPPRLKEETEAPVREPEMPSPAKPVVEVQPENLESPVKMEVAEVPSEPQLEIKTEAPALQPVDEQVAVKEEEEEVEQPVPELVEEKRMSEGHLDKAGEEDKDSQPPVIDKEVHIEEDTTRPDEVKEKKPKKKEGKTKKKEVKKDELPVEKTELPKESPEKVEEMSVVEQPVLPEKTQEVPQQFETPEKDEQKAKKIKGEKKSEKKKNLTGKKGEKKVEEVKSEDGEKSEKKVESEKKKPKKKTKKQTEEEKTKGSEVKKPNEQKVLKTGFDVYDFKEESQDSEQQALLGLASLHNVCLATAPPNNTAMETGADMQSVIINTSPVKSINPQLFRDALALVAPHSNATDGLSQEQQPTYSLSSSQGKDMVVASSSASSLFVASATRTSSSMMYDNTPPDTPEHSQGGVSPRGMASPSQQGDTTSHKSHLDEESQEPIAHPTPLGSDSPTGCGMSTISNSSGGSSGNLPSGESSGEGGSKRKREPEIETTPGKKRRRSSKRGQPIEKPKPVPKTSVSDSDEASNADNSVNIMYASPSKKSTINPHNIVLPPNRPPKFNFNLEEGNQYEGEKRINFLSEKMQEIRKMYMQLKAEVACIDRRRKRARRKEKEASGNHSSSQCILQVDAS